MIHIGKLIFNAFQVNTWFVWDETKACLVIDPGCSDKYEETEFLDFLGDQDLTLTGQVYTHCHIDHILGNAFVYRKFGLRPLMHRDSLPIFRDADVQGSFFGLGNVETVMPEKFISEGDKIFFGNSYLEVFDTPGHVDGHICLFSRESKFVISGDVLFRESIGRTDLPTGNFDLLSSSIRNKLYTLGTDFSVLPGHGEITAIGHEMAFNPFIRVKTVR